MHPMSSSSDACLVLEKYVGDAQKTKKFSMMEVEVGKLTETN